MQHTRHGNGNLSGWYDEQTSIAVKYSLLRSEAPFTLLSRKYLSEVSYVQSMYLHAVLKKHVFTQWKLVSSRCTTGKLSYMPSGYMVGSI
jgi:hypothetical protein